MAFTSINPATGETLASYEETSAAAIADIIANVHEAWREWRHRDFGERARFMRAAAGLLRDRSQDCARLMAEEMGKPVRQGVAEAQKCATTCDYFADNSVKILAPEMIEARPPKRSVVFQPLGVILAVMPWNFPFWQVFRFAAPALMAGNASILKHSSNDPGCALAIEEVFREASFPEHLFRTLMLECRGQYRRGSADTRRHSHRQRPCRPRSRAASVWPSAKSTPAPCSSTLLSNRTPSSPSVALRRAALAASCRITGSSSSSTSRPSWSLQVMVLPCMPSQAPDRSDHDTNAGSLRFAASLRF